VTSDEELDIDVGRQTALGTAAKVVGAAAGYVGTIVFANILGAAGFGGFYLLLTVAQLSNRPFAGWSQGIRKRISEPSADLPRLMGAGIGTYIAWIGVVGVLGFAFRGQLEDYTGLENAFPMYVALVATTLAYIVSDNLLQARGKVAIGEWLDTGRSYLTLGLQAAFVLTGAGAAGMAGGLASASAVFAIATVYFLGISPSLPEKQTIERIWEFSRFSIPDGVIGKLYSRLDLLLLGWLVSPDAAGLYEVAFKLTLPAVLLSDVLVNALFVSVSSSSHQDDAVQSINQTISYAPIISAPLLVGVAVLGDDLIRVLYQSEYHGASELLVLLAVFRLIQSFSQPLHQTLYASDKPRDTLSVSAISLLLNIPIAVALIQTYDAFGAVLATVIAELSRFLLLRFVIGKTYSSIQVFPARVWYQFVASATMGAVLFTIRNALSSPGLGLTLALVAFGAGCYALVLLVVDTEIRREVRGAVPI